MRSARISLPPVLGEGLAAAFPGGSDTEPLAFLSSALAGDMKYGDPACAENRRRFLLGAGIDPGRLLGLELAHTRNVIFPSRKEDAPALARAEDGADGIVLRAGDGAAGSAVAADLAASVTVADCMPIWILDRGTGAFGVLHSGWRGTGILETAVRAMGERLGSRPSSIAVILGPAIGPCCYEVSEERAKLFSREFGEDSVSSRGKSRFLDLRSANISIAERLGIGDLVSIDTCTACDERLGSFRRQGGASFTRMLAVCGRPVGPVSRGLHRLGARL